MKPNLLTLAAGLLLAAPSVQAVDNTSNDGMISRLCQAAGCDVRPLLKFWGIWPANRPGAG